ncbi:hypothetical protein SAMN05444006_111120 [Allgaiera indica]|uniref:Uncharacterized protein n=1 Tax=Allgaiera indica TaxID=765699 RepID=A0A1H2ZQJ7_9RHOB|nr:hypothetical protein SAMN05444006_111120 [Allgaiera indica]
MCRASARGLQICTLAASPGRRDGSTQARTPFAMVMTWRWPAFPPPAMFASQQSAFRPCTALIRVSRRYSGRWWGASAGFFSARGVLLPTRLCARCSLPYPRHVFNVSPASSGLSNDCWFKHSVRSRKSRDAFIANDASQTCGASPASMAEPIGDPRPHRHGHPGTSRARVDRPDVRAPNTECVVRQQACKRSLGVFAERRSGKTAAEKSHRYPLAARTVLG